MATTGPKTKKVPERRGGRLSGMIKRRTPVKMREPVSLETINKVRGMSPAKLKFINEYLLSFNATQAAIAAGYSKEKARLIGSTLLKNPLVNKELRIILEEQRKRNIVSIERCIEEYACMAFLDPTQLFDRNGDVKPLDEIPENARRAIGGIDIEKHKYRGTIFSKIRMNNKILALEALMKHLGGFEYRSKDDNVSVLADTIHSLSEIVEVEDE